MRTKLILFLSVVLSAASAHAADWAKTFTVNGVPELRVDANDGSVRVTGWDRKDVEARVIVTGWGIGTADGVRVEDHQTGDKVEITVRVPHINFTYGTKHVVVEINVPRKSNLDLHSGDGSIRVDHVAGVQKLDTGDGSIETNGADGALDAQTGDGHILAIGRFDALRLRTGDGHIEAEIANGSRNTASWSIRTSDGHVTLRLPEGFAADLDASTGDGGVVVDMPIATTGNLKGDSIRGKMNGGGPLLEVRTGDGAIRIARL